MAQKSATGLSAKKRKSEALLREKAYVQMDQDAKRVMEVIEEYAGVLPFNDKASPEVIFREVQMSKNAFKRAVGRLHEPCLLSGKENPSAAIHKAPSCWRKDACSCQYKAAPAPGLVPALFRFAPYMEWNKCDSPIVWRKR